MSRYEWEDDWDYLARTNPDGFVAALEKRFKRSINSIRVLTGICALLVVLFLLGSYIISGFLQSETDQLTLILQDLNETFSQVEDQANIERREDFSSVDRLEMKIDNLTSVVEGDVFSSFGQLDSQIGNLTSTVNGNINSTIGQLEQSIDSINTFSLPAETNSNQPLHVQFSCIDRDSREVVSPCEITVEIIAQQPASTFTIEGNNEAPIMIPINRTLSLTAKAEGYIPIEDTWEYIEDGELKQYIFKLSPQ